MEQGHVLTGLQKLWKHGRYIWSANTKFVCLYLLAIVAANLITARFGPAASVFNALAFIGLDLTCRDGLHDAWRGRRLVGKMGALILAGSVISWALNRAAGQIAVASFSAFACANVVDAMIYHLLVKRGRLVRVNGSNVFSAAVDSLIFPVLAFGWPPILAVCAGQFAAKVGGGFIWYLILRRGARRK